MPGCEYFMCDFKTLNISQRKAGPHKNPGPCTVFTFYRPFDVDVMKFLKVRGSAVSHKQYWSSAKHTHCRGTLKLIQEFH